jgi:YD repeat-containing protein
LVQITRPDGETINYHYTTAGDLDGVDKPGNQPVLLSGEALPTQFADGTPIVSGNLPQLYDVTLAGLMEVCGPRAAITILDGNTQNNNADGACVDFDYNTQQLSDWWTRGVLNPTPEDNVLTPSSIQTGPSTGFVQWDDTSFFNNIVNGSCGLLSEMSDAYGHDAEWCYDSSSRVTQTSAQASASNWLTTSQTWDVNNDLTSTTDARGNTTNIAYDSDGNAVEVSLPKPQGSPRPTYLYDHDSYNNLTNYCDPANNASNGWNPSPGPTPCASSGSTYYTTFQYNESDPNEQYGCPTETKTPSGYHRKLTYGGNCGNGLAAQVTGDSFTEPLDGTLRTPTQTFTYYNIGTLKTYNPGDPNGAVTQITPTSDGMNRVRSVADPDGVTSDQCYNLDGSVFYSETALQNKLDHSPGCPFPGSGATPPPYARVYGYDPNGNVATSLEHHDCTTGSGNCAANNSASTTCYAAATVPAGTTCNFHDGLDRLVEVKLPYDTSYDLYKNPWVTRYLYDLTGGSEYFDGSSAFSAYGNLFTVEELLPSGSTVTAVSPSPGAVTNGNYTAIKGMAYDGLDRPVTKYSAIGQGSNTTETLTWDTSPLDPNGVAGFLGEDCNSASPSQCQKFDYTPGGELMTFASTDTDGSSPEREYLYDADARTEQISQAGITNAQTYTYNVDGYLQTSVDAGNSNDEQATLTHNRYPDDSEKSLDVSNYAFTQTGLFTYSYRNDGPLQTEQINDSQVAVNRAGNTTISYAFTNAGRLLTRSESGKAASPLPTPQTTITYATSPPTGLVTQEITPVTTLSAFSYTAENELLSVNTSSGTDNFCIQANYDYSLRAELAFSSPNCTGAGEPFLANGVWFQAPPIFGPGQSNTWNDRMAVMTKVQSTPNFTCNDDTQYCTSSWTYDSAARMTSEVSPYPIISFSPPPINTTAVRTYDAENHLLTTQFQNGATNWENEVVAWGPDSHPFKVGTYIGSNSEQDERLHWNGNQLLFTTHLQNGRAALDDVKVDVQGDILPGDGGYPGLTFYDRGPGGAIMGCHNYTGTSYAGLGGGLGPCASNQSTNSKMPTSGVWAGNPYTYAFYAGGGIGNGGTLTMPRTDGINDGFDTIQGVRSYDNNSGSWTTPDRYAGSVYSPASQKSYMWNNNNPMDYSDPSGYDDGDGGQPQPPDQLTCTEGMCQDSNGNQTAECSQSGDTNCTDPSPLAQASASVPSSEQGAAMLRQFGPENIYNILGATLGVFGLGGAGEGGAGTFFRYMSRAELDSTINTGLLRAGREGIHYVTQDAYTSAAEAQAQLSLPVTPDLRVLLQIEGEPFAEGAVNADFGQTGGGYQFKFGGNIPVTILESWELGP